MDKMLPWGHKREFHEKAGGIFGGNEKTSTIECIFKNLKE
jgi:hypothetical protein